MSHPFAWACTSPLPVRGWLLGWVSRQPQTQHAFTNTHESLVQSRGVGTVYTELGQQLAQGPAMGKTRKTHPSQPWG